MQKWGEVHLSVNNCMKEMIKQIKDNVSQCKIARNRGILSSSMSFVFIYKVPNLLELCLCLTGRTFLLAEVTLCPALYLCQMVFHRVLL